MKKKVIGLSTLLLVLLLGLFTTSYALTLTENDIRNFCENAYKAKVNSTIPSNVEQYISDADFSTWANYTTEYEGQWVISYDDRNVCFMCFTGSYANLNTYCMYKANNRIYVNTSYLNRITRQRFNINNGQFIDNSDIYDKSNFMYCDGLVTNNGLRNGTVVYLAGTYKPNNDIFSGRYTNDMFEFSPASSNFELCSINGLSEPSQVYVYDRNNQDYLTLGYLEKFSNLDNITITRYRYTKGNGWVETSVNAFNDFSGYNVQDDILTYTIDASKISADTLVIFNFTPNNIEDFSNITFALYIKSPYTYISNSIIYPAHTFSGDYFNNYNDDSNTDKIVDNNKSDSDKITDTLTDDSQVDSMLSEFTSGDANDLAHKFGYSGIENPFVVTIKNVVESTADVLLGSGNVTLDISFYGHQIILHSEDFVLPSNAVVTLIHLICNGFFIWGLYKYGFKLYQYINTGRIKKVIDETDSDKYYFF